MADDPNDQPEPALEANSARGRRLVRLFLMAAGGLAAPCLALTAFFLSNSGGGDTPAVKSAVVQGGGVTATTRPAAARAPVATATTAAPAGPVGTPPRDPFQPLVTQAPTGGTPAR